MESRLYRLKTQLDTFLKVVKPEVVASLERTPDDKLRNATNNAMLNSIAQEYLLMKKRMRELGEETFSYVEKKENIEEPEKEIRSKKDIEEPVKATIDPPGHIGEIKNSFISDVRAETEKFEEDVKAEIEDSKESEENIDIEEVEEDIHREINDAEDNAKEDTEALGVGEEVTSEDDLAKFLAEELQKLAHDGKQEESPYFDMAEKQLLYALAEKVLTENKEYDTEKILPEVVSELEKIAQGKRLDFSGLKEGALKSYQAFDENNVKQSIASSLLVRLKKLQVKEPDEEEVLSLQELVRAFERYPRKIKKRINSMSMGELMEAAEDESNSYIKEAAKVKLLMIDKK